MKQRFHFFACCFVGIAFFVLPKLSFAAGDRYWVGGSGNWSNTAHWSVTSGGTGGASLPDSQTSCYFDANSFSGAAQTVSLCPTKITGAEPPGGVTSAVNRVSRRR